MGGDAGTTTGTKSRIRSRILKIRNALTEEERKHAACLLTERILEHQWYCLSDMILCYADYGSEISTRELILKALAGGKKVFLPRVEGESMTFYRIHDLTALAQGYKGISEPRGDTEKYCGGGQAERTLLLMPGVAFDRNRNRIGYGKGFYDRFLAEHPELQQRSIAVGYQCQLVEELPAEETDIRPCQVICV
ncbi:MAG: 5-formyltetrahydrofolate cyclo-ligase [Lachnospiraceae bacterium]|nr:5-formyltetrahydrofolate cyclo-ligase [Lachnospiraceae bacterium]MCM1239741.1 5-formyltetrahydrofolate cyclo-ligase [Lachnospiraceae bacterium]